MLIYSCSITFIFDPSLLFPLGHPLIIFSYGSFKAIYVIFNSTKCFPLKLVLNGELFEVSMFWLL